MTFPSVCAAAAGAVTRWIELTSNTTETNGELEGNKTMMYPTFALECFFGLFSPAFIFLFSLNLMPRERGLTAKWKYFFKWRLVDQTVAEVWVAETFRDFPVSSQAQPKQQGIREFPGDAHLLLRRLYTLIVISSPPAI